MITLLRKAILQIINTQPKLFGQNSLSKQKISECAFNNIANANKHYTASSTKNSKFGKNIINGLAILGFCDLVNDIYKFLVSKVSSK